MGKNTNTNTPISALAAEYNFLPEHSIEKRIAQIILSHISELPLMTLEQAAAVCDVSISTFSRFCQHMGYTSFSAFKGKICSELENYPYSLSPFSNISEYDGHSFMPMMQEAILKDMENISSAFNEDDYRQLIKEMHGCSHIYFHDTVYSTVRLSLQCDLAIDKKTVTFSPDNTSQKRDILTAGPDSMFIFIYDGHVRSREVLSSLKYIHTQKNNIKTVLFSPFANLPSAKYCNFFFKIPKGSTSLTDMMFRDLVYQYMSVLYRENYISNKDT